MPAAAKKKELRPEDLKDVIGELITMGRVVPVIHEDDPEEVRFCLPKHAERMCKGGTL